jgi:hypothetical protein
VPADLLAPLGICPAIPRTEPVTGIDSSSQQRPTDGKKAKNGVGDIKTGRRTTFLLNVYDQPTEGGRSVIKHTFQ